ncbi:nuclear transport factor 2 family protein (plasmid) [Rhizobium bangladeshense]|uniref:nuclear transport factor 2 family protein n=1 Tax=Rhizobium bangladeshense TaxID=1138189 RepID=UPI001A99DE82|nr:nuclear transport factor 2 family protein [Rhizobium bangladeshense]QSY98398.1 nuclear transport factor 2 family protein [Rhizobium bangladeshense]
MTIKLPEAIEAYFDADRDGSPDAVAAAFTENGSVKDKGKSHTGRDAIRKWMADESQQYSYTVEPFHIALEHGKTLVTAHAVGTFPGSPIDLRFLFVLAGDKVAELEITA